MCKIVQVFVCGANVLHSAHTVKIKNFQNMPFSAHKYDIFQNKYKKCPSAHLSIMNMGVDRKWLKCCNVWQKSSLAIFQICIKSKWTKLEYNLSLSLWAMLCAVIATIMWLTVIGWSKCKQGQPHGMKWPSFLDLCPESTGVKARGC